MDCKHPNVRRRSATSFHSPSGQRPVEVATAQTFQTFEMGETKGLKLPLWAVSTGKPDRKRYWNLFFPRNTGKWSQRPTYFKQWLIMTGNYLHSTEDIPQKITPSSSFSMKNHTWHMASWQFNFSRSSLSVRHRHSASHHGHELLPGNPRAMHGPNRNCHPPAGGHFRPVDRWMILMKGDDGRCGDDVSHRNLDVYQTTSWLWIHLSKS